MAQLTQVQQFSGTVTATMLNNIAGTATVTSIANADIANNAEIADTKLATLSTANKVNATALIITNQATGDILYYSGTAWVRLAAGTVGQVLTMAAGLPSWA